MTETMFDRLASEFPRSAISWRAQSITKDGDKAMALAYIDARDVMDRLDEVVGPENWSDSYHVHPNVTICSIAIRTPDGWVTKADGAGDTDVEAEKGRISDALKRAAVRWGIGRYLYALSSPWVPCESYETERSGKKVRVWKRWTADPWSFVKDAPPAANAVAEPKRISSALATKLFNTAAFVKGIEEAKDYKACDRIQDLLEGDLAFLPNTWTKEFSELLNNRRDELTKQDAAAVTANASLDRQYAETMANG